jgi:hypothetical protein
MEMDFFVGSKDNAKLSEIKYGWKKGIIYENTKQKL